MRQLHRQARYGPLGSLRLARRFFDDPAASVARGEIAAGMNACRIFTQNRLHPAHCLDDLRVLQFGELAQTSNRAGDQHQIICFFGMLAPDDIGQLGLRLLLNPFLDRSKRGLFLVQLFAETRNEMGCQLVAVAIQFRDDFLELLGTTMGGVQKAVGPKIS